MSKTHTPGPWFVRYCDDERFMCMTVISSSNHGPSNNSVFENENDTIAVVYHQCNPTVKNEEPDEADANAKLISAAPELLDALISIEEYWNGDCNDMAMEDALVSIREIAREAIDSIK